MKSIPKAHLAFAVLLCLGTTAMAAPPDLTNGGVPGDTVTINLGPTGLRAWVHHVKANTGESRQIQVKSVAAGSPADGILAVDDVILGANGTGSAPVNFSSDARKALANAINDAEERNPAILKLIRWRAGVTSTVDLTLQTLGAYSATAPYNCPKSSLILERGLQSIMAGETTGRYSFGTLSLLAGNNPSDPDNAARMARAQTEARLLIPSAATMAQLMSDDRDATSMVTWQRGHTLIVLTEYYLRTGDALVLPAIEAYAVNIAKNQSLFGTVGHIFAEKHLDGSANGPMGGVYGTVNSTGLPCFYGLLLAKKCGLTNPELAPAIERSSRFFAYYAGKGGIPYGEHEAYYQGHETNGKSGLAAIVFSLQENRAQEQKIFAKMATAATSEREGGHTGAFFNYLWSPLGAAAGGEEAAAAHFNRIRWMLDLNRRWDGGFDYDCLNGEGPNSGSQYNDFRMSTAALLLYALPLRQLVCTGKNPDSSRWLDSTDVAQAAFSDTYSAPARTTAQLVTDLGNWSPKIQRLAADELAKRTTETTALLPTLHALANNPNGSSRVGACFALGKINNSSSAPVLAALLTDPVNHVRFAAAEGMRYMSQTTKMGQLNTILAAAASTGTPLVPYNEEDPLHFAHARLAMLLFYGGTAYGPKGVIWNTVTGVDRNYLYPAIRAVAANPIGQARSTLNQVYKVLTTADVNVLADTIVDSVHYRAPADKMFSGGIRLGGLQALQAKGNAEGVPLCIEYDKNDPVGSVTTDVLGVLKLYAGRSNTVVPDSGVIDYLKELLTGSYAAEAQLVLDAIAANPSPTPLTPFKSIQSVTADAPSFNLPAKHTVLRVNSTDLAKGNSIYTWRKLHGAGNVSFFPNGTAASKNTTILFDGIPGQYLFEVKMSDSRDFTEVYQTVTVALRNSDGSLPPDSPPTANPQTIAVSQATPAPVTLTGSDPEGHPLVYTVMTQPLNGTLSGTVPYLLYSPDFTYSGPDGFTFKVTDSQGQVSTATINITVGAAGSHGLAIYEPFNYPAEVLGGKSGASEIGLGGTWAASTSAQVVAGSLAYGMLPTLGGSIGNLNGGSNNYGGTRAISASALAANGLLNDGSTLWFSVVMGYGTGANLTNSRLALALSNSNFSTGNNQYYIANEGSQLGSGLGVSLGRFDGVNGKVVATRFRDSSAGTSGTAGNIFGTVPSTVIGAQTQRLVVGKITWGATPSDTDMIELFEPDTDLIFGSPTSTLAVNVNQSAFDAITWCRGDVVTMDEIRFGPTQLSVLVGNAAMSPDLSPPVPNPVGFHSAPAPSGPSSITMVAATAYDPTGVEYYFTCTAGGGHDSGWQAGTTYTDTGLTPGIPYSYTMKARDKSPAKNTTTPSAAASATIATQAIVPHVVGLSETTAGSFITTSDLTVGSVIFATSATVPLGDVISQSPIGEMTAAMGAPVNLVVSGTPSTGYGIWSGDSGGAFLGVLIDPSVEGDFDGGGLSTGIEWVVGGDPTDGSDDSSRAPVCDSSDPQNLIFTFKRRDAAHADPGTTITVQYATGLNGWNTATHGGNGVNVDATAVPEAGFHTVVVSIPKTLAGPGGKLFARLKVATTP